MPKPRANGRYRKYTVSVSNHIYCTSSFNYFGEVKVSANGYRGKGYEVRQIDLTDGSILAKRGLATYRGYPAYATQKAGSGGMSGSYLGGGIGCSEYHVEQIGNYLHVDHGNSKATFTLASIQRRIHDQLSPAPKQLQLFDMGGAA